MINVECRRTACPLEGCGAAYVMQEVDSEERRKERTNPAPQWAVPRELIEWQPSYTQSGAPCGFPGDAPSLLAAGVCVKSFEGYIP